ncbi:DUF3443 family protein [Paraburkholderia sp. SIMBA_054]|uniref:DUF3443 family protein n=1 Tax=Paraburkholderia sp. SIMBA_054 TaxID=3085795 RepID=UPI003978C992
MRKLLLIAAALVSVGLAACGGGGGGGNSTSKAGGASSGPTTPVTAPSGGGLAADATATPTSYNAVNAVPVTVSNTDLINQPMVSVTVCQPGTGAGTNCTTVPNIIVDTESFGLRLFASAIPSTLGSLTGVTDTVSGKQITECLILGTANAFGSVRTADIKLSGEVAQNVPVHILADPAVTTPEPSECIVNQVASSPATLHANGILGIGTSREDCGIDCQNNVYSAGYYASDSSTNTSIAVPVGKQVTNPVALFPVDNNGVVLELPQVSDSGTASTTGTLVFGIDTQANNALSGTSATLLQTTQYGDFRATYNGGAQTIAFFDSGSNAYYFGDTTIPRASNSFYTPTTPAGHSVTISATNLAAANIGFNIANANTLAAAGGYALNNVGAYHAGEFNLGLPFFFGRHVYHGIGGTTSPGGGAGPYVAYTSS